jgi:hypothetical protein
MSPLGSQKIKQWIKNDAFIYNLWLDLVYKSSYKLSQFINLIENFPPTNLETKYAWMEKIFFKLKIVHPSIE